MAWLRSRDGARDAALAVLIFAGTVLYIWSLPLNLGFADEAVHLYESKRMLDGEVLYRDVFEMITPGFMTLMAVLFRLFGTTLATARLAQAVVHGITAVALFATCRRLEIRRGISGCAALAYLVVCQAAWPIVSQHWLSTMFCVLTLLTCVDLPCDRPRATLLPGVMLGLLIGVQHQRGVIMAAGVFVWVIADSMVDRRCAAQRAPDALVSRLAWLIAGALLIDLPMMIAVFAYAGFEPVWRALVIFPLFDYRGTTYCEWGHLNIMSYTQGTYTFPRLLKYLPVILPVSAFRLAVLIARRHGALEARRLTLLLTLTVSAALSIWYFPDFIHIAFIAPFFFATAAETLEWSVRRIPAPVGVMRAMGWGAAAVVLLAAAYRLEHNRNRLLAAYPVMRSTAFGEIALADEVNAELYDRVNALVPTLPGRDIYCYPVVSHLYLMTGAHNPTPYGFLSPGYSGPDLIQHVVDILEKKQLPYLVVFLLRTDDDPISDYIRREYEPLDASSPIAKHIYRRRRA